MTLSRSHFLALSSFFLLVWFRFENFFHSQALLSVLAPIVSLALFVSLWKSARGKSRYVLGGLWLLVTAILVSDCIQTSFFNKYSDSRFEEKISEVTAVVRKRAYTQVEILRKCESEVRKALDGIEILNPSSIFIGLEDRLSNADYGWAIYDPEGELLAWNGEFPPRETRISPDREDITVYTALHQQFIRLKRMSQSKQALFIIVANRPIAADYGLRNRYLVDYNLLTDNLPMRPDLLYNSQVSAPPASELVVRPFDVTPDFSVSALFKKPQYQDYLHSQRFHLHWWFELAALLYLLFGASYCFFKFVGVSGKSSSIGVLLRAWIPILLIGIFGSVLISEISAFGTSSIFQSGVAQPIAWDRLRSPGGLLLTSFFALNALWSFALLMWKCELKLYWRYRWINYISLPIASLLAAILIQKYLNSIRTMALVGSFDPTEWGVMQTSFTKLSQQLGILWMDLSFLVLLGIVLSLGLATIPKRNFRELAKVFLLQLVSGSVFLALYEEQGKVPLLASLLLYFGVGVLVFFLPRIARRFGRINLFSRFLIALLLFSTVSFVFYFTRFHYTGDLRRDFVEQAARQVQNQDELIQTVLSASRKQMDQALATLSIDPKISDLAFRLWTRTDLSRYGLRSALEIYDGQGRLVNRFSVNLPRLAVPILDAVLEGGWGTERRTVVLGNARKPVHFAVRDIPGIGYLVIEAAQDYESLPFTAPSNPFQELFRFHGESQNTLMPDLNVYDLQWRPIFVSRADLSLSTQQGQNLLRESNSGWVRQMWGERALDVFYFRINNGFAALLLPAVTLQNHFVPVIELLLINLAWLSFFSLIFVIFFRQYLVLHFPGQSVVGLNFFQKLLIAFVVFSMVPMVSFSLVMRNYAREKKIQEVTSRALDSFSVATRVVGDYLFYRAEEREIPRQQLFSNELLEWISQVIQQDVTFYYSRYLLAASNRELYSAGLMPDQMSGQSYVELFLKGQKYSINEASIGNFHFLNVSGRIFTGRYRDEVITIPFLLDERSVQEEISELREYMILVGAGLVLLAVLLGFLLANRFSRPVEVLIHGTGEMSRGNLQFRIQESYRDEFRQLVNSFNTMAQSLDDQKTDLERRRAYIENILNNITTAVVSVNDTMNIATYNPAAVSLFRMTDSYSGPLEGMIPDSREWKSARNALQLFLANKKSFALQEVAVPRGEQEIHLRMVYVPMFSEGRWNGALLLVEDITDIIRSNRLSAWAEMARRVAHEVKNPLTPIQLSIEHLMKVYEDHSPDFALVLRECSETILKQVKALRRLVSDFSLYGRPGTLHRTDVDLESFLNDLVSSYRLPEGIDLKTRIPHGLPHSRMDVDKIRGALMNIIENGLQAMNGSGRIILEAEKISDDSIRIQIQDTGRGIPAEIVRRLFEPYFSTKTGGTGLGLAIARKNIEDHGGKIHVESTEGKGTTVTVELPV